MSDYTQIFDDSVSPINLIGQTTLSAITTGFGGGGGVGVGGISTNWYPSGRYYGNYSLDDITNSVATGTLYFHPFYVTKTTTYTDIGFLISSTAAGTIVLGLYNDSGNSAPTGSPITNSNSTSITNVASTLSKYTFSSPIQLIPGVYWCAYSCSATNASIGPTINGATANPIFGRGLGVPGTPTITLLQTIQAGWSQAFVYSATLPSVGSLTATGAASAGDKYVYLK